MPILGTRRQHEFRSDFNTDALRRKQLDKHLNKIEFLMDRRRPGDTPYTPQMIYDRLISLGLEDRDFETMKQYRKKIYDFIADIHEDKPTKKKAEKLEEETPIVERTEEVLPDKQPTAEQAAPKRKGRPKKNEE